MMVIYRLAVFVWAAVLVLGTFRSSTWLQQSYDTADALITSYDKMLVENTNSENEYAYQHELVLQTLCTSPDHPEYMDELQACVSAQASINASKGRALKDTHVAHVHLVDDVLNRSRMIIKYGDMMYDIWVHILNASMVFACCALTASIIRCAKQIYMGTMTTTATATETETETEITTTTTTTTTRTNTNESSLSVTQSTIIDGDDNDDEGISLDPLAGMPCDRTTTAAWAHRQRTPRNKRNKRGRRSSKQGMEMAQFVGDVTFAEDD